MKPSAYLLDIEGTTTPIDFVTKTLFPYARRQVSQFLGESLESTESRLALIADCCMLAEEWNADKNPPQWDSIPDPAGALPYLLWLMDHDRKSTALKSIQGRIWEQGYASGKIQGEVYPDVWPAVEKWKNRGAKVYIYSSGSILAQKLLFRHLPAGDLTQFIDGYFDTTTGPKRDFESYKKIADSVGLHPSAIHFLSDVQEEVSAALTAEMHATIVDRSGNNADAIRDFDNLE